jgi:hypothetical protein
VKCSAKNKSGGPCGAFAIHGTQRCVLHTAGNAQRLGVKGGHRRARYSTEELTPIAPPQNVADILRALGQVFTEVHDGRLEPKVANACAYLASGILQAVTASDFEARIAELEKRQQILRGAQ